MTDYLRQIPNALTVVRIVLVVPFAVLVLSEQFSAALVVLLVAGFTDGLDGFLARYFDWKTLFGSIADPVADKFLLVTTYICLGLLQQMPWWLVVVVVGRDMIIFSGAISYWFLVGKYEGHPTFISKLCTFCQIVAGVGVLAHLASLSLPGWFFAWYPWLLLVLCSVSLVQYVKMGVQGYQSRKRDGQGHG